MEPTVAEAWFPAVRLNGPSWLTQRLCTAQNIKKHLIHKAKVRKQYAKVREQELGSGTPGPPSLPTAINDANKATDNRSLEDAQPMGDRVEEEHEEDSSVVAEASPQKPLRRSKFTEELGASGPVIPHAANEEAHALDADADPSIHPSRRHNHSHRPKPQPFQKEVQIAEQQRAFKAARREAKEEAMRQREKKLEERERFRRAMARAKKPGLNGQIKLGRESKVLLERVKKMVGEGSQ